MRSYLAVWRLPSAPVLLLAGFAGRLPSSMVPLALLLMVQEQTGSYAIAGGVSATYGIATAVMAPVLGRLADRRSPRLVLFVQSVGYPLLLALMAAAVLGRAPLPWVFAAAAAVGGSTPLVSGTVRALWSRVDVRVRPTAYALDATATELVFVAGPTLVAALTFVAGPAIALGLAAVLGVLGALGIATSAPMRAWRPVVAESRRLLSTVTTPGMPRVLLSGTALMFGVGGLEVAVPAFADDAGSPGISGLLLAVWALGSAGGGLWFGARVVSAHTASSRPEMPGDPAASANAGTATSSPPTPNISAVPLSRTRGMPGVVTVDSSRRDALTTGCQARIGALVAIPSAPRTRA